ncbi:hypothetical protein PR202_ga26506 [Eleusine coracana subsp. coracana]|uniref:Uncharacterized protein n=1 Tax=Eleusine coracana subsp. coracana TaxID=191504 RepID=A0AAV5DDI8_ELECO|nr:hypothetical protein PR202_ga26506 [Eleusine coracana subsp. coracana]
MRRKRRTTTAAWTSWSGSCNPCSRRPPAAHAAPPGPCCRLPSRPSWFVPLPTRLFAI